METWKAKEGTTLKDLVEAYKEAHGDYPDSETVLILAAMTGDVTMLPVE